MLDNSVADKLRIQLTWLYSCLYFIWYDTIR